MLALLVMLWNLESALGAQDTTKKDFLADYEPAAKRLEDFYRRTTIRARAVTTAPEGERSKNIRYEANDRLLRLEISDEVWNGKPSDVCFRAMVTNPKASFWITKKVNSDRFQINKLVHRNIDYAKAVAIDGEIPFAPFCWRDGRVTTFLKFPNVSILKIEDLSIDGETLCNLTWKQEFPRSAEGKDTKPWIGWFLFDPARCWVLRGHRLGPLEASLEYGPLQDGVPMIKKLEYWYDKDGSRSYVTTITVSEIKRVEAPEKDFTLAAFGMNDVPPPRSPALYYLLAFGFIGLIVAGLVRRLAQRKRA
jgi:hypothetical protein